MNNTFGIWAMAAGAIVLGVLLLLGGSAVEEGTETAVDAAVVAVDDASAEGASEATRYWQPVTTAQSTAARATTVSVPATVPVVVTAPELVGGCGYPSIPCGRPTCGTCVERTAVVVPTVVPNPPAGVELAGGCGMPSTPCGGTTCYVPTTCCYDVCADPCRRVRPGINRNMPLCVNECSFLQLHSTVAHPICTTVCFEWSASKGWFLDSTASDPLYFAPSTQFCQGEEVWITLLITDASGAQYSDVVSLIVRDLP